MLAKISAIITYTWLKKLRYLILYLYFKFTFIHRFNSVGIGTKL